MNSNFTKALDMIISMWYHQKYGVRRPDKFLTEKELGEFIQSVYDYSYYLFSESDLEAMDRSLPVDTSEAMNKIMIKKLDEPYSDEDVELIQETLERGGNNDKDTIH